MFKKLSDFEVDGNWTITVYGQSGAGKTLLAGGWPNPPVLVVACDPGPMAGATTLRRLPDDVPEPLVLQLRSYSEFIRVEGEIVKAVETGDIRTVVVDSLTYLQQYMISELLVKVGREAPRMDDYRLVQARTARLITFFADLPATTIFNCLEAYEKDEMSGGLIRVPDLVGQLGRKLAQYCDIVGRAVPKSSYDQTGARVTKYQLFLDGDETYVAKDRTGLLPKVIDYTGPSWDGFKVLYEVREGVNG